MKKEVYRYSIHKTENDKFNLNASFLIKETEDTLQGISFYVETIAKSDKIIFAENISPSPEDIIACVNKAEKIADERNLEDAERFFFIPKSWEVDFIYDEETDIYEIIAIEELDYPFMYD